MELEKHLDLYLDGVRIDLPSLQSVVVLNIDSWGAGVKLWGMQSVAKKRNSNSNCTKPCVPF